MASVLSCTKPRLHRRPRSSANKSHPCLVFWQNAGDNDKSNMVMRLGGPPGSSVRSNSTNDVESRLPPAPVCGLSHCTNMGPYRNENSEDSCANCSTSTPHSITHSSSCTLDRRRMRYNRKQHLATTRKHSTSIRHTGFFTCTCRGLRLPVPDAGLPPAAPASDVAPLAAAPAPAAAAAAPAAAPAADVAVAAPPAASNSSGS